jgi:hypothetical protein
MTFADGRMLYQANGLDGCKQHIINVSCHVTVITFIFALFFCCGGGFALIFSQQLPTYGQR